MLKAPTLTRASIFLAIAVLAGLMLLAGSSVLSRLSDLSRAQNDNMQWTISQAETELASLTANLADAIASPDIDQDEVRLRLNLALSRLNLLQSGRTFSLLSDSETALTYLLEIDGFYAAAAEVADRSTPLTPDDVQALRRETEAIRGIVRQLAVEGVILSGERTEARREEVVAQLRLTAGAAALLIFGLVIVLLALDHLLARARRSDKALRVSSDRLSSTVAASLDAIVVANDTGHIIEFNPAAEQIFGWSRDEILGHSLSDTIVPVVHRQAHTNGMERYLKTHDKRVVDGGRVELSALRKSGEEFPVELNITSIQNGAGTNFIAYLRDISDRKIAEASLISARDRAEKADRAKSRFLAVMSHEMRTPLNGILGVLDLMRTSALTDQQERYVKIAAASGEILLEHINEALDVTRIESGDQILAQNNFNLEGLISGLIEVLRPLAEEKGLKLVHQIEPEFDWDYVGDSLRIRQILTNLLGNAIKFTRKGEIWLNVTGIHGQDASSLTLTVSDTGPGIAAEDQEKIFDEFVELGHRAEGRQLRGDGMGLAISRRIARQMDGDLSVSSIIGMGSQFKLTIPLIRASRTDGASSDSENQDENAPAQPLDIIVVEDNAVNRSVMRDMLGGLGHSVFEARDGLEAISLANERAADVILMDISMPNMDGIEATRRIRTSRGPNAATPIYGITAHGREEYRELGHSVGMTGFYAKPMRLPVLKGLLTRVGEAEQVPEETSTDGVNTESLAELRQAIGPDKLNAAVDQFERELLEDMAGVQAGECNAAEKERRAVIHRLCGAAGMLGFDGLNERLVDLSKSEISASQAATFLQSAATDLAFARSVINTPE